MIGIKCKSGHVFAACNSDYIDAEWKLQEAYYKAQGCEVIKSESVRFSSCNCKHCQSLEHEFENLIDEIQNQN
ncbi:MAG: hypothetical protein ACEQSC_01360 [Candidatus Nanopelagicaceae bacterium]